MNKELQEWCDSLIKGACFHCEDVALRNIELKKENARLRELVIEAIPELLFNEDWSEKTREALERGE